MKVELPLVLTCGEIAEIVGGEFISHSETASDLKKLEVKFIATDTRGDVDGALFIPLRGKNFDGHDFIDIAFNKGAIASLSSRKEISTRTSKPIIFVGNTHKAFLKLGAFVRKKISPHVIAIGGSAGKTTTKELSYFILSNLGFKVSKSIKSFNNDVGLAFSLSDLKAGTEVSVLEIGTSHRGEIAYLAEFADPDSAVLLSVGKEHLEGLESEDGVFDEEISLIRYVYKRGGISILNIGEPRLKDFFFSLNTGKKIAFAGGRLPEEEARKIADLIICYPLSVSRNFETKFKVEIYEDSRKESFSIHSSLAPHFSFNIAGAISSVVSYGWEKGISLIYSLVDIDFKRFENEPHRFSVLRLKDIILVDDTYNSNPVSLSALFSSASFVPGKKFFVLGDMLELGIYAEREHYAVGDLASKFLKRDEVLFFLLGNFAKDMKRGLNLRSFETLIFDSERELIESLVNNVKRYEPDYVFFKASRGCRFDEIFEEFVDLIGQSIRRDKIL